MRPSNNLIQERNEAIMESQPPMILISLGEFYLKQSKMIETWKKYVVEFMKKGEFPSLEFIESTPQALSFEFLGYTYAIRTQFLPAARGHGDGTGLTKVQSYILDNLASPPTYRATGHYFTMNDEGWADQMHVSGKPLDLFFSLIAQEPARR
jgi:hypothetical protein